MNNKNQQHVDNIFFLRRRRRRFFLLSSRKKLNKLSAIHLNFVDGECVKSLLNDPTIYYALH